MKLTTEIMEEMFDEFNAKYFDNTLEKPKFKLTRRSRVFGSCRRSRNRYSTVYTYEISMTAYYDRTIYDYQNTMLHEMIHLYLFQTNADNTGHGKEFKYEATRINADGWNIQVRCENQYTVADEYKKPCSLVMFYSKYTKKHYVMRYNENNREYMKMSVAMDENITDDFWFSSDDAKYNSLPCCRKRFRGVAISKELYDDILHKHKRDKEAV